MNFAVSQPARRRHPIIAQTKVGHLRFCQVCYPALDKSKSFTEQKHRQSDFQCGESCNHPHSEYSTNDLLDRWTKQSDHHRPQRFDSAQVVDARDWQKPTAAPKRMSTHPHSQWGRLASCPSPFWIASASSSADIASCPRRSTSGMCSGHGGNSTGQSLWS